MRPNGLILSKLYRVRKALFFLRVFVSDREDPRPIGDGRFNEFTGTVPIQGVRYSRTVLVGEYRYEMNIKSNQVLFRYTASRKQK